MNKLLTGLLLVFTFFNCGENSNNTVAKKAMIQEITATAIVLNNGEKISFPESVAQDESVIFIIRPGAFLTNEKRNLAPLTTAGIEYAERINKLLQNAGIQQVMAIATRYANETVKPTADNFGLKTLTYNNTDYGAFLDFVFGHAKGQRILALETRERIPEILRTLTPGKKFDTYPPGVFNKLYVAIGKERTRVKVYELYF